MPYRLLHFGVRGNCGRRDGQRGIRAPSRERRHRPGAGNAAAGARLLRARAGEAHPGDDDGDGDGGRTAAGLRPCALRPGRNPRRRRTAGRAPGTAGSRRWRSPRRSAATRLRWHGTRNSPFVRPPRDDRRTGTAPRPAHASHRPAARGARRPQPSGRGRKGGVSVIADTAVRAKNRGHANRSGGPLRRGAEPRRDGPGGGLPRRGDGRTGLVPHRDRLPHRGARADLQRAGADSGPGPRRCSGPAHAARTGRRGHPPPRPRADRRPARPGAARDPPGVGLLGRPAAGTTRAPRTRRPRTSSRSSAPTAASP